MPFILNRLYFAYRFNFSHWLFKPQRGVICQRGRDQLQITNYKLRILALKGCDQLRITNYELRILALKGCNAHKTAPNCHCGLDPQSYYMQHTDRIIGGVVSLLRLATKISGLTPLRKNIAK